MSLRESCRILCYFATITGKNLQYFTEIVNEMMYNRGAKTREVAQGKNLSGQLHSGKCLDAPVVFGVNKCDFTKKK